MSLFPTPTILRHLFCFFLIIPLKGSSSKMPSESKRFGSLAFLTKSDDCPRQELLIAIAVNDHRSCLMNKLTQDCLSFPFCPLESASNAKSSVETKCLRVIGFIAHFHQFLIPGVRLMQEVSPPSGRSYYIHEYQSLISKISSSAAIRSPLSSVTENIMRRR